MQEKTQFQNDWLNWSDDQKKKYLEVYYEIKNWVKVLSQRQREIRAELKGNDDPSELHYAQWKNKMKITILLNLYNMIRGKGCYHSEERCDFYYTYHLCSDEVTKKFKERLDSIGSLGKVEQSK